MNVDYKFFKVLFVFSFVRFLGMSNNGANRRAACKSNSVSISKLLFIGITTTPNLKKNKYSTNKLPM